MKLIFKVIIIIISFAVLLWIGFNLILWYNHDTNQSSASFTTIYNPNSSLVKAVYFNDSISIEFRRLMIETPNKYLFYTPKYYSKDFYSKIVNSSQEIQLIEVNGDTIMEKNGAISPVNDFPDSIKIRFSSSEAVSISRREFNEYLPKLSIPIWNKISYQVIID